MMLALSSVVLMSFSKPHLKCLDYSSPSLISTGHQESNHLLCLVFPSKQWKPMAKTGKAMWPYSHMMCYTLTGWTVSMISCRSAVPKKFSSIVAWFYSLSSLLYLFPTPSYTHHLTQLLFQGSLMVLMPPTPIPYWPHTPSILHYHCHNMGR